MPKATICQWPMARGEMDRTTSVASKQVVSIVTTEMAQDSLIASAWPRPRLFRIMVNLRRSRHLHKSVPLHNCCLWCDKSGPARSRRSHFCTPPLRHPPAQSKRRRERQNCPQDQPELPSVAWVWCTARVLVRDCDASSVKAVSREARL